MTLLVISGLGILVHMVLVSVRLFLNWASENLLARITFGVTLYICIGRLNNLSCSELARVCRVDPIL